MPKQKFTLETVHTQNLLMFEMVSGSQSYGTALPNSDTDLKGVFVLPKKHLFGLNYVEQVADKRNDEVYYELSRFVALLLKNNPNLLEMLAPPAHCVRKKHPLFDRFKPEMFLSKRCKNAFAGYAYAQVKKARGLNKKINNPMDETRKNILAFCHVLEGQGSKPLLEWLAERNWRQENCGLVKIPHARDLYGLYYDAKNEHGFSGIMKKEHANDVTLSSIPKEMEPVAWMSFNLDGYQSYCRDYKNYWEWVKNRNEARYENTLSHGKNYDSKNMMHTFRLLDMAKEIGEEGKIIVQRPNRDFLLKIRAGEFEYSDLVAQAEERLAEIDEIYEKSALPDAPDEVAVEELLVEVREKWYRGRKIG